MGGGKYFKIISLTGSKAGKVGIDWQYMKDTFSKTFAASPIFEDLSAELNVSASGNAYIRFYSPLSNKLLVEIEYMSASIMRVRTFLPDEIKEEWLEEGYLPCDFSL